ncbi:hypothetical protein Tco_0197705, partial [Tanacetum coccineum]
EEARDAEALETENQSQNGSDGGNGNGGNGNGGNGNGGNRNGRNKNPDENGRGDRPVARECTYQDFLMCQPLNFKGTEGVVGLISALTWWNSHKRTIRTNDAFSMTWRELMLKIAFLQVKGVFGIRAKWVSLVKALGWGRAVNEPDGHGR